MTKRKKPATRSPLKPALPLKGAPRLLFRGDGKPETARELDAWDSQMPEAWRLVVDGDGGNMASSWKTTYQVCASDDGRAWVLSMADWGDTDEQKDTPDVSAIAAYIDPDTSDEDVIVQALLDVAADWFNIDEVNEEGEFKVTLPGFD